MSELDGRSVTQGDAVAVPVRGDFLVRDGKVTEIGETELVDCTGEEWAYTVWVKREDGDE